MCEIPGGAENANPIVREIFKDCGHPAVQEKLQSVWIKTRPGNLLNLLNARLEYMRGQGSKKGNEFGVMKDVLRAHGLPLVFSFITAQESGFTPARGQADERGHWQIMPANAISLKIPVESLWDIRWGTEAASRLIKENLLTWARGNKPPNIKMVLASYNAGPANVVKTSNLSAAQVVAVQEKTGSKRLTLDLIRHYTEDFWELLKFRMIRPGPHEYVPSVLAAIFAGVRPDLSGLANDPNLSFTDLN
jgi:hypothetical protein